MVRVLDRMAAETHVALARGREGSQDPAYSEPPRTEHRMPHPFAVCLLLEWHIEHPIEADSQGLQIPSCRGSVSAL